MMTDDELRRIPKIELHRHLEGSVRLSTLKELAPKIGLEIPQDEERLRDFFLVTRPMQDLGSVLDKFLRTRDVLRSEEILTRITYEAVEDACKDGIRILELRYAPTFLLEKPSRLDMTRIFRAIRRGLELAKEFPVKVGLIATVQRTLPVEAGRDVIHFALDHRDAFVGVDLADKEVGFEPTPFAPIFNEAKRAGMLITIHAGEANVPESPQYVIDAVEKLGADRIGHGVQIIKSKKALEFIKERQIPLELCPTSNWLTNAVPSLEAHPIRKLMEAGVAVTINTDDPGVFGIDLVHEYRLLADLHGFTLEDFQRCNQTAALGRYPNECSEPHGQTH